jgi:hypothetical protein
VMIVHLICLTLSMCCPYNFALVNYQVLGKIRT